jgi:glycerol uptake facilitator-like aquaporin
VTLCFFMRRAIGAPDALAYVTAQLVGVAIGTWCAHVMLDLPVLM